MDTSANTKILKHLMVLNLEVNIWSAQKKLSPSDFGGVKLPPDDLASLGNKKICNPESLRIFTTLKARAVTMLDRIGVRFLGGWGIPENQADQVVKELKIIHDEFMEAKDSFLKTYDQNILDWINQHPEWKNIIKNSTVDANHVSRRMGFRWQLYQVVPPKKKSINEGLKDEVSFLGSTLYHEVAKVAEDTWNKCYSGKEKVSQKAISPLKSIHQKLNGLSFIDPCAAPIADLMETAFSQIPHKGFIQGADLLILHGILALLRDPDALVRHGNELIKGKTPESIIQNFSPPEENACPVSLDDIKADTDLNNPVEGSDIHQEPIESFGLW